jgi:eukaryotic-like serine/threonine-protein kinase
MKNRFVTVVACALLGALATVLVAQAPSGYDLTLVDMDGTQKILGRLPASVYAPRVSPGGRQVAFETRDPKGPDGGRLWVADFANIANRRPLPSTGAPLNWAPMWTPDGQRLAFIVSGDRPDGIYWRRADGSGEAEHLIDARAAEGWNDTGATLRFLTLSATGKDDYGIAFMDVKTRTVTPVVDLPGTAQHSSAVSPDGKWMAYASNETGRYEVWLMSLPPTTKRYQITTEGGSHPLWLPGGKSLSFDRGRQLFRVELNLDVPSAAGSPVALPIKGFAQAEYRRQYDLLPNGKQFLMLFPVMP